MEIYFRICYHKYLFGTERIYLRADPGIDGLRKISGIDIQRESGKKDGT